jgi:hypothetical protein
MSVVQHAGRTFDVALDRKDPRSRAFAVRTLVPAEPTKPIWWAGGFVLDQGPEGSCAGHAVTAEFLASPVRGKVASPEKGHELAVAVYDRAKVLDEFPGTDYDGTSINAVMKVGRERGWWDSYHWAFGLADVRRALLLGPVVIGVNAYESMYDTVGRDAELVVKGEQIGGHALLVTGWSPRFGSLGETFRIRNSWGAAWGKGGNCYARAGTLERLLGEQGEAAVPTGRHLVTA